MNSTPSGNRQGPYSTLNNAVDVHDADVHTIPINELFHRHTGLVTTLAAATIGGVSTQIQVNSIAGFNIGDPLQLFSATVIEPTHPVITNITGSLLILDRPIDTSFAIGDSVEQLEHNMGVVGTLATPVSFKFTPDPQEIWHVISFIISMTMSSAADDSLFGNIAALTNGCVLRGFNGQANAYRTFTNWKTNADVKLDMYDVPYTDKAGPGLFGVNGNGAIRERTSAVPKLNAGDGDFLELLVQDDLTGLVSLQLKGQGHIEGL